MPVREVHVHIGRVVVDAGSGHRLSTDGLQQTLIGAITRRLAGQPNDGSRAPAPAEEIAAAVSNAVRSGVTARPAPSVVTNAETHHGHR